MDHTFEKKRGSRRRYCRYSNWPTERAEAFLNRIMDKKIAFFMMLFMVVMLCSILFIAATVTAKLPADRQRITTSVLLEEGDSLWSIAEEYYTEEYKSIPDYIEVIKACNQLESDIIHAGGYLIVPYYQN